MNGAKQEYYCLHNMCIIIIIIIIIIIAPEWEVGSPQMYRNVIALHLSVFKSTHKMISLLLLVFLVLNTTQLI